MPRFLDKFVDRMTVWSLRTSKGVPFDGIGLVDFRGHGDSFSQVIESSLRLVQEHDARRYARIKKHISWIVNHVNNALGAQYVYSIRACFVQFDAMPEVQRDVVIAMHACVLVHEATHGVIESRGIKLTADNGVQIERLCTAEQNRFATRLSNYDPARYPRELLQFKFDERHWVPEWKKSGAERGSSFIKRWVADHRGGLDKRQENAYEEWQTPVVREICSTLIRIIPPHWNSVALTLGVPEHGLGKGLSHSISSPEGHKDVVRPTMEVFAATRKLELGWVERKGAFKKAMISAQRAGADWSIQSEYEHDRNIG